MARRKDRKHRIGDLVSDFVARLMGKEWDHRARALGSSASAGTQQPVPGSAGPPRRQGRGVHPVPGGLDEAAGEEGGAAVAGDSGGGSHASRDGNSTRGFYGSRDHGSDPARGRGPDGARDSSRGGAVAERSGAADDVPGPGDVADAGHQGSEEAAARAENPDSSSGGGRRDAAYRWVPPPHLDGSEDAGGTSAGTLGSIVWATGRWEDTVPASDQVKEITLERVRQVLTGPMCYRVQDRSDYSQPHLTGVWDSFPFVIEIPEGHEGWLLVAGHWEEAGPLSQRDEIAASVNDWNREKFFPTVGVVDTPTGPLVRATYLVDCGAGVSDDQLQVHLGTALSACTQALSQVGPLLPEL